MMRALLLAAVLAAPSGFASAESWDVFAWGANHLAAVDKDSVTADGAIRHVRVVVITAGAEAGADGQRGLAGVQEIDCAQGRYHTLESTPFGDDGALQPAKTSHAASDWLTVAPGTLADEERKRVCGSEWSQRLFATSLAGLVTVYRLRPDPPPPAEPMATPSASDQASDAAAKASAPP